MTKSEIKSEISDCQTSIDAENVRITELEEKIKYYEAINSKLVGNWKMILSITVDNFPP